MEVEQLSLPKKKLEEESAALKEALKANHQLEKSQMTKDLLKVYGFMNRYKGKIVDVPLSFKKAGLNEDGDPRLAIARADAKTIHGTKYRDGSFLIQPDRASWKVTQSNGDIQFSAGTFSFPLVQIKRGEYNFTEVKNERIQAPVPIIPAKLLHLVKSKLSNYSILWEVDHWKPEPPKDPMLLRQLTPNLFGVLAVWNLTPLEKAVIRGRL